MKCATGDDQDARFYQVTNENILILLCTIHMEGAVRAGDPRESFTPLSKYERAAKGVLA